MSAESLIIKPSDHPIRPELIDDDALLVMRKLNQAGFSSYLVGGGVRDLYLGKTPKDFDISTDARPGQVRRLFTNSRTIGRRFRLVQVFFKNRKTIEVSTLRSLSEHDIDGPEAILAPNNTFGSLDEDAQRRDLTINGLFYEIESHTIIDHVGGVDDLDHGIIRLIGIPQKRITHDPVRMLRTIRHSARNNFNINDSSLSAIREHHHLLSLCPASRLRDELLKDLYSGAASDWFRLSDETGLFTELFPIYKNEMETIMPDGTTCREQLQKTFATIDRLNKLAVESGNHRRPDYFHLAFLLIPWATINFNLVTVNPKGPQLYQLAKNIRENINQTIGIHLNFRRSTRQEITTLLAHLPILIHNRQQKVWPKWLKRKSYFKNCRYLFRYYQEAIEGEPVPESSLTGVLPDEEPPRRSGRSNKSRKKGRPAFSNNPRGGIFGLKR